MSSTENYPYHRPQIGLTAALVVLSTALQDYYVRHPPCPGDVQTALLLTPRATICGEREETFNHLQLLTELAYSYGLGSAQEEQLAFCLQQARRTLLLGDVFIEGVDYTPDLVVQGVDGQPAP